MIIEPFNWQATARAWSLEYERKRIDTARCRGARGLPLAAIQAEPLPAAVVYPGPCASIACHGIVKTRVLLEETANILTSEPRATVLVITLRGDAAAEVRERLELRVSRGRPDVDDCRVPD